MRIGFIIPGDIDTPTGGYRYDRAIIDEWRKAGLEVDLISLPGGYPFPCDKDRRIALSITDNLPDCDIFVVDGLAGGCFPQLLARIKDHKPVVALIHHPLALENGLNETQAARLKRLEQSGLDHVAAVITTSPATSKTVHTLFGFDQNRIFTVLPGVKRGAVISFRRAPPIRLLSVGSMTPRKGHDILLKALARLKTQPWVLDIVGATHFNPAYYETCKNLVQENSLEDRVVFHSDMSEEILDQFYTKSDIFVLASRYEGYGMVFAEAIVCGLPVIATRAGAIIDTVPESCGLLVPADNVEALCKALQKMMSDEMLRQQKHEGTLAARPDFPEWKQSANHFSNYLKALL